MPTAATDTYTGIRLIPAYRADKATRMVYNFPASVTLAQGTVVGEISATPGIVKAYASGNTDGSQNPVGILEYPVTTDASGNITNLSQWGSVVKDAPVYTCGAFRTQELVGLDANAVTKLGGHLSEGSVTNGVYEF